MASVGELLFKIAADVATFKADMGKIESEFTKATKKMESGSAMLGKALAGAFTAAGVIAFTKGVRELAKAGDELADVTQAFETLGGSASVIDKAQQKTLGMVAAVDLMKSANKAFIAGVPEVNKNFADIADFAGRVAEATGGDIPASIDQLVGALAKGQKGARILAKDFGIFVEKGDDFNDIMRKMKEASEKLPPIGRSVDQAFTAAAIAFGDLHSTIGRVINDSPALERGLNNIATNLSNIARWIEIITNTGTNAQFHQVLSDIADLTAQRAGKDSRALNWFGFVKPVSPQQMQGIDAQLAQLKKQKDTLAEILKGKTNEGRPGGTSNGGLADEFKKAREEWEKFTDSIDKRGDELLWDKILGGTDAGVFQGHLKALEEELSVAFDKALAEFKSKGGKVNEEQARNWKEQYIANGLHPFIEKWESSQAESAKKGAEEMAEAHKKAAEEAQRAYEETFSALAGFFESVLSEALETGTIDFSRLLKQVAIEFVSTIAAGLAATSLGNLGGGSIGQTLGAGVLQNFGISVPGVDLGSLGVGAGLAGGAGMLSGTYAGGLISGASGVIGPVASGAEYSGMLAAGAGMGPAGWAALAAAAVLAIGSQTNWFGLGGGMSAGQRERADIRQQIAEQAGNDGNFSTPWGMRNLFDVDFADFTHGTSGVGDAAFGQMSGLAAVLTGGGEQMDEFQSILAQMATGWEEGATQAENLNQVLVAQMSLMSQMGMTAEEAKASLLDLFFQGKISLEEFSAGVEQMNLIATENLIGEGSISDALSLLADNITSDPRTALHALMLAFKEASEVSADQLGAVREVFVEMFGPEAASILDAFAAMGIDTWEELKNASIDQIIFIFGQLQQIATDTVDAVAETAQTAGDTIGRGFNLNVDARGAGPGVGEEVRAAVMSMRGEIEQISAHATQQMLARNASFGGAL